MRAAASFAEEASQLSLFPSLRQEHVGNSATFDRAKENGTHSKKAAGSVSGSRQPKSEKIFSVVSMFSGCGGMDLGFSGGFEVFGRRYDPLPFQVIWANDNNIAACKTYRRNLGHEIECGDVWTLLDSLPKKADILIGGFPCQDISVNGKRAGVNGHRSGLYRAMVEAIRRVKPKIFVAENVKGLLMKYNQASLQQVLTEFGGLGYKVHFQLYRAADYGVPQTRERVFIVGTASNVTPFTPPAHERSPANWMTAREALMDLESTDYSVEFNHIWSLAKSSPEQGSRRLRADRPAYTIRAECHGNIQYHYRLPRRISMREAARIQSFPDKFVFESRLRETERQVGNAVPPVLAWHIANSVLACLT
ncbi:MAG: DNA cytosine methyltransferase [Chloroflexi bacterium]|nr:DNA cytosine methyltransferase [Chloroflexota bacterium]MBE3118694.1 DNA cytosine methyltransferase [Candidatus Atribacteria bacterium]